ncbi:hypothetical protein TNCV_3074941 [Trichonephila clavipes]|nr:hypothetical protein TNCV_3074941 [Trichonephila clavipes]
MLDKNHGALSFQTAWECICACRTNRTIMRAVEERRLLRREESPEEKETWTVADRDWSGKRGEILNANGVGEPETMNAGGVGGLESMV